MKRILAIAIIAAVAIIFVLPQVDLEPTVLRFECMLCAFWVALFLCLHETIAFCLTWKPLVLISGSCCPPSCIRPPLAILLC